MTVSRAEVAAARVAGSTRATLARAQPPQRWVLSTPVTGGPLVAVHQLLGDGVFGGDRHQTRVHAGPGASLVVRAVAATPLRGGAPSSHLIRLRADEGAQLTYLPGALIPHASAQHASSLLIDCGPGASVLAASIVTPGRVGRGEHGAFAALRLRTRVRVAGALALDEDASLVGGGHLRGPASFGDAGAWVSILALGGNPLATPEAWPGAPFRGGATYLRADGAAFRGLAPSLGDAWRFVCEVSEIAAGADTLSGAKHR